MFSKVRCTLIDEDNDVVIEKEFEGMAVFFNWLLDHVGDTSIHELSDNMNFRHLGSNIKIKLEET